MLDTLQYFTILPLLGFLLSLFIPRKSERLMSGLALGTVVLHLVGLLVFIGFWLKNDSPTLLFKQFTFYKSPDFEFFTAYHFDKITAVFALVGGILTALVAQFSRFYMHRDDGFKRFFCALLLFFAGYNLVVFSGNFETLFIGWEILGITSFVLIAFYRDRFLPVKNAFKVLSFYRLGDVCLVLAMWMSHHIWHKNITFGEFDAASVQVIFTEHYGLAMFVAAAILLAAVIKSAQLPFSTWLPRAMEGPTTSSAIFYGSLSVHIGAFLLLRTATFWGNEPILKIAIIAIGLTTAFVASLTARVQSTVKTRIAYSSIAQIGLIFVEIALGWHGLALFHFAANAFLRTYQLLVSPSELSYQIHDMFFNFKPKTAVGGYPFLNRLKQAVYILSIREWNFDGLLRRFFWQPFKWIGSKMGVFLGSKWGILTLLFALAAAVGGLFFAENAVADFQKFIPVGCAGLALLLVLKAFSARGDARFAWLSALFSQIFMAISIIWNKNPDWQEVALYLGGSVVAAAVGYFCLQKMHTREGSLDLHDYHGHAWEYRGTALVFLLACLAFAGFPITPSFIGTDLMFTHIGKNQPVLVAIWALHFLFLELTLIRIYARIFMGPHRKMYHPIAFKSS